MGVEWNNFLPQFIPGAGKVQGGKTHGQPQSSGQADGVGQTTSTPEITVDMSELEVKAAMNQAMGLSFTSNTDAVRMAKIDAEFAKDPVAFAAKYGSGVRANAEAAAVEADYALQAFRGETELAAVGPQAFVKSHLNGQPAEVARNFTATGLLDEFDKNRAASAV